MTDIFTSLRDRGWQGKALALRMGCVGDGKIRRVTRYKSTDQSAIEAQCDLLQASGFAGVVHIWNGPAIPFVDDAMMRFWAECQSRGLSFAIMLDQWIAKGQANPTQAVIDALTSAQFQRLLASDSYLPEKYLLEFNLNAAAAVNVAAVQAAVPSVKILSENSGYGWVQSDVTNLARINSSPNMKMPGLCLYFNDGGYPLPNGVSSGASFTKRDWGQSVWGKRSNGDSSTRVTEHQAGNWLADQMAVTPISASYILFATLDDHEEGTGIEHFLSLFTGRAIR